MASDSPTSEQESPEEEVERLAERIGRLAVASSGWGPEGGMGYGRSCIHDRAGERGLSGSGESCKMNRVAVPGRKGLAERKKAEIGMLSVRAGDISGEHTVLFGGIGERIELTHRAHSRDAFGRGAIRAAQWLVSQKKGLYTMRDVLGFVTKG